MGNLIRADQLFMGWKRDLLSGKPPVRWALADEDSPLNAIQAEPGRVKALGWQRQNGACSATGDGRAEIV